MVTDAVTNGGAGVYVKSPEGEHSRWHFKYCSNYMVEVLTASMIRDSSNECQQVAFLSDVFSVLEVTAGDKLPRLAESLRSHSTKE